MRFKPWTPRLNFDGRLVNYDFGELDEIVPAYAVTTGWWSNFSERVGRINRQDRFGRRRSVVERAVRPDLIIQASIAKPM
jgi:hypothetical protein